MLKKEGLGWRLSIDPKRKVFPVLIGGDGWAIELTQKEWHELFSLISDLTDQHKDIEGHLMHEEALEIELERNLWWGCLEGNKYSWNLAFVLKSDEAHFRGVEFCWPTPASDEVVNAMRNIWDSYH